MFHFFLPFLSGSVRTSTNSSRNFNRGWRFRGISTWHFSLQCSQLLFPCQAIQPEVGWSHVLVGRFFFITRPLFEETNKLMSWSKSSILWIWKLDLIFEYLYIYAYIYTYFYVSMYSWIISFTNVSAMMIPAAENRPFINFKRHGSQLRSTEAAGIMLDLCSILP